MPTLSAAYVSVTDAGLKPSSSRNPVTRSPPCQPEVYWPRAEAAASPSGVSGTVTASRTFSFSARRWSASNEIGSSIAVNASSCRRWFWMTSRAAPTPS